ncbi:MAG: hypothetical protein QOI28_2240 [Mycobacterium sp.]|jgi:hypothetical protein|nr:hypothetical protein [Mycobacterium sp.]MDT5189989.1 hypothetical protein [Mycobacterium sp.]MDT5197681.1 hypothetical protein [Mycobacterium sp.]MDT5288300.1 hypothetical protein [Mycobacterium sp.]
MSINQSAKGRRNTAATLLLAAGAAVLGGLVAAAPANAADAYVALSYSLESKIGGTAVGATPDAARLASLQNCQNNGGNHCVYYVGAQNSCVAIAIGTDPTLHQEWSTAINSVVELARKQALSNNGGGVIGTSGCTTSMIVDPPPLDPTPPSDPTPPPPPPPPADPVEHDYDNDGLSKHDELFKYHTNPFLADTDFDGVLDGKEVTNGTNPLNPSSH